MNAFRKSFAAGYACLAAWANLLDKINVFPVADGDTGANLRISLAPLRDPIEDIETTRHLLARCATGNSGNIAAAFFREFCRVNSYEELAEKAMRGSKKAWQAPANPCAGTMLTVFDSLADILVSHVEPETMYAPLRLALEKSVQSTTQLLPDLHNAGVVDSGALAMYIFFDGFFRHLTNHDDTPISISTIFAGKLAISTSFRQEVSDAYCVDVVLQMDTHTQSERERNEKTIRDDLTHLGESLVVVQNETCLKIHIHTPDPLQLREAAWLFRQYRPLDRCGD